MAQSRTSYVFRACANLLQEHTPSRYARFDPLPCHLNSIGTEGKLIICALDHFNGHQTVEGQAPCVSREATEDGVTAGASLVAAGLPEETSAIPELLKVIDVVPLYLHSGIEGSVTFAYLTAQQVLLTGRIVLARGDK